MRIQLSTSILTLLCTCTLLPAQVPDNGAASQAPAGLPPLQTAAPAKPVQDAPPPAPAPPSGLLQPSLDTVQQALGSLKLDKWKRGNIRDEAGDNIDQIQRDIQNNLPALMKDADGAPGSLSKLLSLARNVDALYDVLLRVVEASRVSAPGEQAESLQQALAGLSGSRHALESRMLDTAAATEKQMIDLRATVQRQAAFKCPAPPPVPVAKPCPAPRRARRRPAAGAPAKGGAEPKSGQGNPKPSGNQKPGQNSQKPGQANAPAKTGP